MLPPTKVIIRLIAFVGKNIDEFVKKYNPPMCEVLGITPPEGYVAIEAAA